MRALLADEDLESSDGNRLRRELLVVSLASRIGLCSGLGDFNTDLTSSCVSFLFLFRTWILRSSSGDLCLHRCLSLLAYTLDTLLGEGGLAPLWIWTRNEPSVLPTDESGAPMGEMEPSDTSFVRRIECFSTDKSSKFESKAFRKDSALLKVTLTKPR